MKLTKMCRSWSWQIQVLTTGFLIICSVITANSLDELQNDGPIIIASKSEIILNKGQNYTIYCQANTPVQIKQQEQNNEEKSDNFKTSFRTTNVTSTDLNYDYKVALDLINVDQYSVGYYACFDETLEKNIFANLIEEPKNNEHVSYIYVYVNGTGTMFAPMKEIVGLRNGSMVIIECRPTTPDVNVTLIGSNKRRPDIIKILKYSPKIGFLVKDRKLVTGCKGNNGTQIITKHLIHVDKIPAPTIASDSKIFLEGETFTLSCTVPFKMNSAMALAWELPRPFSMGRIFNQTNEHEVTEGILYNNITIVNATKDDEGTYTCVCHIGGDSSRKSVEKLHRGDTGYIRFLDKSNYKLYDTSQGVLSYVIRITDYPRATYRIIKDNIQLTDDKKYHLVKDKTSALRFKIENLNINDTGIYTLVCENKYVTKNYTVDVRVRGPPRAAIVSDGDKKFQFNSMASLICNVIGYPQPKIKWTFTNDLGENKTIERSKDRQQSVNKVTSEVKINAYTSGNVTCSADNEIGNASSTIRFIVYEVPGGFGFKKNVNGWWYPQGQDVSIKCYASKNDYTSVTWLRDDNEVPLENVGTLETTNSYVAQLKLGNISLEDAGSYTCKGQGVNGDELKKTIDITVGEKRRPEFTESILTDTIVGAFPYQPIRLSCQARAVPPPQITWKKDGEPLHNTTDCEVTIITEYLNEINTIVNSSIDIKQMSEECKGKYECIAVSDEISEIMTYSLVIHEKSPYKSMYLSIAGAIMLALIIVVAYLAWKIRKEKKFRRELAAAGLLYFKEGVPKSLNPDLGIDEQAELLPYDDKFEFPPEKLEIGKQLGAGAFGVVYKADARGIINAEETTPVAVKMVKKTADNMYIKALASELKIMVHLGKHINIVNLLGACTKNAGKRELIVIVEYCKFGNIHNYIQRHRDVFIDQLTDNKDKNLGKVNRAFSCSSGTGASDYFSSNHSQNTDHTFVNTANSNKSGRKDDPKQEEFVGVSETGYIQPEWRSNYQSDYTFDGRTPRPLTSRDLLAWAFQIARGMEYLASRKVLHGDLAARNVLLAEDNIVKICDFGLARSIYKNDEYKKQENSPLPIKWLAIECMTDRIFSTQSDVWSFGVVLWELFSLAKTPYPDVSPNNFLQFLIDGHRMEKPQYADDQIYDVMRQCWEQKPTARPNFTQLQEILGSFLEANVRNHYVDLNSAYNDMNMREDGYEDYLAMVSAPDYNNLVTPSPHHYANDTQRFILPSVGQLQHDSDGYLQMSPARNRTSLSPPYIGNRFDFDPHKTINIRMTEPNCQGSESTPMLTLNNLPAKGSESDHDGNFLQYNSRHPTLEEEADDVFELKSNLKNLELNKNNSQNCAVTNPTYISFDIDKKPQNISNNYINVHNVPNGLVK